MFYAYFVGLYIMFYMLIGVTNKIEMKWIELKTVPNFAGQSQIL